MYTLVQENLHALQAEQQIGKIYKYVKVICNVISIVETIRIIKKLKNNKRYLLDCKNNAECWLCLKYNLCYI